MSISSVSYQVDEILPTCEHWRDLPVSASSADKSVVPSKSEHRGGGGRHLLHHAIHSLDVGWVGRNDNREGDELLDLAATEFGSHHEPSHSISSFRVVAASFSFGVLIPLTEMLPR